MSDPPILTFWTVSGDVQATALKDIENAETQILHQEKGKKSSFLLNLDDSLVERPDQTQIIVENDPELQNHFFLGGFQIVSNAKQSKVYLTGRDGKEAYLTTSKGIPFDKESGKQWYKSVCVVPGGPRLIKRLRLEILNVQQHEEKGDDDSTLTKIRYLKLTARIPDKAPPSGTPSATRTQLGAAPMHMMLQQGTGSAFAPAPPSLAAMFQGQNGSAFVPTGMNNPSSNLGAMPPPPPSMAQAFGGAHAFSAPQQMQQGPPPLTQDDLGAAMAGVSMMARSTQENMEKSFQTKVTEMQEHMDAQWGKVEGYIRVLTQVVVSQKTVLEEKNKIMQQQHEMVAEQSKQIATLLQQQTHLQSTIQTLQSDMKALQQQVGKSLDNAAAATVAEAQITTAVESPPPQEPSPSQDVLEAVAKTALAEQQAAISPAIESIQTNMESLSEYIKGNQTQDLLKEALENIQTDVKALREISDSSSAAAKEEDMPNNYYLQQEEKKLSSTLEALQSEMAQLRQSIEEDNGKRDEKISTAIENVQSSLTKLEQAGPKVNDTNTDSSLLQEQQQQKQKEQEEHQQALSASVDALEKDVATLRESVEKTAQKGSSQQKALENNLDSLKSDLSEMQRSIQEKNAESMKQQQAAVVVEESSKPPKVKEIMLTGIRDFDHDIFAIRSLEQADGSADDDDDEKKVDQLLQKEKPKTKKTTQLIELEMYPTPLTPDRPPREHLALKESLVLNQSIKALKEFRQINQGKDQMRSASSGDSSSTNGSVNSTATPQESVNSASTPQVTNVSSEKRPPSPGESTASQGSVNSTSTPQGSVTSTSTPPTPNMTNVSTGKPPLAPNSTSSRRTPSPSLNRLVNSGSLVDNEDDELIHGEIVETDVSFSDDGEFIVSVETQDASSAAVMVNVDRNVETEQEAVLEQTEEPASATKSTGPAKRNFGSLVVEPNGNLVLNVDDDGISLDDVDLASSGENEGGAKANAITSGAGTDGEKGAAVKENTSNNVVSKAAELQDTPKDGKRVSFRDTDLEDRFEYSPEVQMSGSTGDSVGTEETPDDEPESEGILEMGMKLFNNAGWL